MALKKESFDPSDIEILALNILKSEINQEKFFEYPGELKGYEVEMSHETAYNFEEKAARIRLYFTIEAKNKREEKVGIQAKINLEFQFKLKNGEKYIHTKEKKIDFYLAVNLMSVAYATARGIIWQLTLPTALGGVIIPVIDAGKFLKEG